MAIPGVGTPTKPFLVGLSRQPTVRIRTRRRTDRPRVIAALAKGVTESVPRPDYRVTPRRQTTCRGRADHTSPGRPSGGALEVLTPGTRSNPGRSRAGQDDLGERVCQLEVGAHAWRRTRSCPGRRRRGTSAST